MWRGYWVYVVRCGPGRAVQALDKCMWCARTACVRVGGVGCVYVRESALDYGERWVRTTSAQKALSRWLAEVF